MKATDPFETLVLDYYGPLFRFALSLTGTHSDAEDLTQQTFYVWATKGHQVRDFSKIKTWLFTTLHNAFRVAQRRNERFEECDYDAAIENLAAATSENSSRSDYSHLLSALGKVDEVYRAAVALFYLEEYCYSDIAVILDVAIGTVKSRIARGIAQLREIILTNDCTAAAPIHIRSAQWDLSSTTLTEQVVES